MFEYFLMNIFSNEIEFSNNNKSDNIVMKK